jgi:N-formylglutamate amidohydrolase
MEFTKDTSIRIQLPSLSSEVVPLFLDSPHSGNQFPDDFKSILSFMRLRRAEDAFVNDLFSEAPNHGASLIDALFPRSYMDTNRAETDFSPEDLSDQWPVTLKPSEKGLRGTGLVWVRMHGFDAVYGEKLPSGVLKHRIDTCWVPYHSAVSNLYDQLFEKFGCVYHLNCHSMRAMGNSKDVGAANPRPDFILSDREGTTCEPGLMRVTKDYLENLGYMVSVNYPFKGAELIQRYSDPSGGRHSMQIEINRRLYMNEKAIEKLPGFDNFKAKMTSLIIFLTAYAKSKVK